jgi:hypothetical protein
VAQARHAFAIVAEEISRIRDQLYDALPTGDVDAFSLIMLINGHVEELDKLAEAAA